MEERHQQPPTWLPTADDDNDDRDSALGSASSEV